MRRFLHVSIAAMCGIAFATPAFAQPRPQDVVCRKSETQAECHARLQCKADEELEQCQKRLLRCTADESLADCVKRAQTARRDDGGQDPSGGERRDDRGDDERGRDGRDDARDDRDDRGDDRDRRRDDRDDRDAREGRGRRGDRDRSRGRRGDRRGGRGGDRDFTANKTFGLGLELGEPTGLNGKVFVSDSTAIDFGVGWIYRHYYYGDGVHLYGDVLFHPVSLASTESLELPFYVGVGLRLWDFDFCAGNVCTYGGSAVGVRVPLGLAFDFNNVPLDIFVQLVPVLDFIDGDYYDRYRDRTHLGIDGSLGFRYWFK